MNKLFSKRRSQHFMLLLRYWRLVFNDHFVIALFFLFGALAMAILNGCQPWDRMNGGPG